MVVDQQYGCSYVATMVADLTPFEALMRAVDEAGSQSALARVAGVSSTAVWKWVQSSKRVPPPYVLRVEAATGVSRHLLRPDIYPMDLPAPDRFYGVDNGGTRVAFVDRGHTNRRRVA